MSSLLQFPKMKIWFKMDLTQSHLRTSFHVFFYPLSFSFNKAETSSFAYSVQRDNEVSGTRRSRGPDWLEPLKNFKTCIKYFHFRTFL
jgi:hypothetical protein